MDIEIEILKVGIAFGSVFTIVIGVMALLVGKLPNRSNFYVAVLTISGGFVQFFAYFNINGFYSDVHFLNYYFIPFLALMGPSTYMHFFAHLDENFRFGKRVASTLIPGTVMLFGFPILQSVGFYSFERSPLGYFHTGVLEFPDYAFLFALLYNAVFYLLIYRRAHLIFDFQGTKSRRMGLIFLAIFLSLIFLVGTALASILLRDVILLYWCVFVIAVLAIFGFLFRNAFPDFYEVVNLAVEKAKYKFSQIQGLDLEVIRKDLERLMADEKIYLDEDLNLAKLAERLDLKPYQLSEFLNQHVKSNFSQYINTYRVERAAEILLENSKANILSVAYNVGFNSKATFNLAFKKVYGKSPREYLRERRAKEA